MPKRVELEEKRFGRWTVLRYAGYGNGKARRTRYLCKCDCGKEKDVDGYTLRSGQSTSCGCLKREQQTLPNSLAAKRKKYRDYKNKAKKRNLAFEITFDNFIEAFTCRPCHYCFSIPNNVEKANGGGSFTWNGIDRKDNSVGYTQNNCVPCCSICNMMKRTMGYQEFLDHVEKIYKYKLMQV